MNEIGILYIVATPIGNLEDMTLRAIRILKEVDLILCEDTRTTKKLLDHHGIVNKTINYDTHSTNAKADFIFKELETGKNIALVSDAGTPCISDPGVLLISQVRARFGSDIKVVPVPGASALTSALSASGISAAEFTFLGFLPHKKGRETLFKRIAETDDTFVFYESTHRILKTLESLSKFAPERKITIARELTKMFEEFLIGTPAELLSILETDPQKQRGEFVVIVGA